MAPAPRQFAAHGDRSHATHDAGRSDLDLDGVAGSSRILDMARPLRYWVSTRMVHEWRSQIVIMIQ